MRLYLVRHGETEHNRLQIMQGHGEAPLNDRGIRQVTRLGQRLAAVPIEHIYSSDLRRAAMTAAIIAAHTGAPIEYHPGLRERDPGQLTGRPYAESMPFFTDPGYHPPGGESVPVFGERVRRAFEELLEREGGRNRRVAVVSHGMVCAAFARLCVGLAQEELADVKWPNASLTIAEYNGRWNLIALGDASHLDDEDRGPAHAVGA